MKDFRIRDFIFVILWAFIPSSFFPKKWLYPESWDKYDDTINSTLSTNKCAQEIIVKRPALNPHLLVSNIVWENDKREQRKYYNKRNNKHENCS